MASEVILGACLVEQVIETPHARESVLSRTKRELRGAGREIFHALELQAQARMARQSWPVLALQVVLDAIEGTKGTTDDEKSN